MSKKITGLTQTEAKKRLQYYGANSLPEPIQPGLFSIFLCQFKSPFIYVLLAAALVSLGLGQNINSMFMLDSIVNAITMGSMAFAVFYWQISQGVEEDSARNTTLLLMVLFENVHVFNSRSETISIFRQSFFSNPLLLFGMLLAQAIHIAAMHIPGLNSVLSIEPVPITLWGQLLMIALIMILVDELHKLWHNHKGTIG